jgi:small subunit ribosomal protein S20
MPVVHIDAKKRARQNVKRAERNTAIKSGLKTASKKFLAAVAAKDKDLASTLYKQASGMYDRAASKGVIHKNAAARKKSRLKVKLNGMGAAAPVKTTKKATKTKAS